MSIATSAANGSASIWDQAHRIVCWLRRLLYVTVGLFAFVVIVQATQLYRLASDVSPWLGYAWLGVVAAGAILVGVPVWEFLRMPRVVQPPKLPPADALTLGHLSAEVRYLDEYLSNCSRNSELTEKSQAIRDARSELTALAGRFGRSTQDQVAALDRELTQWVGRVMPAILDEIDRKAERIIYQESLAVGLATAASPNGTLDAFVMLWRAVNLSSKLATLYYGRPGVWGTLAVCRDVSVATAMAGYMQNVSESLGSVVAKSVGGITGVVAGPAIDGATNALVLIRIGYLTQNRCRSFRQWDTQARQSALVAALASTQRIAVGLTAELLRQVGSGLTAAASAAATGMAHAAASAATRISAVAESAISAAVGFGQSLSANFRGKGDGEIMT